VLCRNDAGDQNPSLRVSKAVDCNIFARRSTKRGLKLDLLALDATNQCFPQRKSFFGTGSQMIYALNSSDGRTHRPIGNVVAEIGSPYRQSRDKKQSCEHPYVAHEVLRPARIRSPLMRYGQEWCSGGLMSGDFKRRVPADPVDRLAPVRRL
jgi:hypothetical protein